MVSTPLKSLSIGANKLGTEGVSVLCESLKTNTTLETLNMHTYGSDKMGAAEAKIIAEMLKVNTPLTKLDLQDNGLDAAAKALIRNAAKKKGMSLEL